MKVFYLILFFCFLISTPSVFGQTCNDYPCVIRKVKKAMESKNYKYAFEQLESAKGYSNKNEGEMSELLKLLFNAVEKEKQNAITSRDDAKKQKEIAEKASIEISKQIEVIKTEKAINEKYATPIKSKDLAGDGLFHSLNNNPTLGLRLAYEAIKIDSTQLALKVFEKILYENDTYYQKK